MINVLTADVAASLELQKYPATVVYGPTLATPEGYPFGLIVFERSRKTSDTLGPPQGSRHNPSYRGVRRVGAQVRLYLQSGLSGARSEDHEDLCEAYVDALLVAIAEWCSKAERGSDPFQLGTMRYLSAEERNQEQQWPGVVYEIQFSISRAVMKVTFEGEIGPTGTPVGVANKTLVRQATNTTDPPAINCDGGTDLGDIP